MGSGPRATASSWTAGRFVRAWPGHDRRIVFALLVFAVTQILYWEDVHVSDGVKALFLVLSLASAITLLVLTVRVSRHRPEPPRTA
jgi:fucose permease